MSAQLLPHRPGEPDCRDYLRTGRCKYGDSCKYNHPSNVMSGGGIKGPIDPNEPPFPIRPNEQPCPYYLKHGTCKFGQTCKFHHPVHLLKQGNSPTSPVTMLNVNGGEPSPQQMPPQLGEFSSQLFLPQRPGEQDCVYFLRNGRCKYGASCKYHHPRGRARCVSAGSIAEASSILNFQIIPSQGSKVFSLGQSPAPAQQQQATHILLSDGPIALMAVNQNPRYPLKNSSNVLSYVEVNHNQSALQQQQEQAYSEASHTFVNGEEWARNSRSQQTHDDDDVPEMPNHFYNRRVASLTPNVPDRPNFTPQINPDEFRMRSLNRRAPPPQHHAYLHNAAHQDAEIHRRWGSNASLPTRTNENNGAQEFTQDFSSELLSSSAPSRVGRSYLTEYANRQQIPGRTRPSVGRQQENHQGRNMDDGLSMMTSALLTMLDTPEENGQLEQLSQITNEHESSYSSQDFDQPIIGKIGLDLSAHNNIPLDRSSHSVGHDPLGLNVPNDPMYQDQPNNSVVVNQASQPVYREKASRNFHSDDRMPMTQNVYNNMMPSHMQQTSRGYHSAHPTPPIPMHRNDSVTQDSHELNGWSPSWREYPSQAGHNLERSAQSVAALQNTSSHATPKIGLYLS